MEEDGYNMAISGSRSFNASMQANKLIEKMKNDPEINFEKDWKMVTIVIGPNDLCAEVCRKPNFEEEAEFSANNVAESLYVLYNGLPRTFVNLMLMIGKFLLDLGITFVKCKMVSLRVSFITCF